MKYPLLTVAALCLIGCVQRSEKITAREITIVDENGNPVIMLTSKNGLGNIAIFASKQKDANGKAVPRFMVSDMADGSPSFFLKSANGNTVNIVFDGKDAKSVMLIDTVVEATQKE